jgi:hypothetical protein
MDGGKDALQYFLLPSFISCPVTAAAARARASEYRYASFFPALA